MMAQQNGSAVPGKPQGGDTHGQVLTGKQEHCASPPILQTSLEVGITDEATDLKRELIAQQVKFEITELNSPTALQRFGAPFKSDFGEVSPLDSELPILRYIFVHHVREFPFLDKAKEKEFWQDKLQVVSGVYLPVYRGIWILAWILIGSSSCNPLQKSIFRLRKTGSRRQSGGSCL